MSIRAYLPSAQFTLIVGSIFLSGTLVFAAERFTNTHEAPATLAASSEPADANWAATLASIQAQNAESALTPPDPNAVQNLLAAAQSSNLTDTVGRTLLVNFGSAKAQGLGDDIPTQDQIVAAAQSQISSTRPSNTYTAKNLNVVPDTVDAQHEYGNGVIELLVAHPHANHKEALALFGVALEDNSPAELKDLSKSVKDYTAVLDGLIALAVPQTLAPFHLQIVNNLSKMVASMGDMQQMFVDPLRAVAGMQTFELTNSEMSRLFTTMAQNFAKNGILFNKDELGSAWSVLISP